MPWAGCRATRLADWRRCLTSAGSGRSTSSRCATPICTRSGAGHVLFQASTIGALLDGSFDGDLTFAELRERGDLGLGTLNGLDGEMICLDGEFLRADVDGAVTRSGDGAMTPFAVVTRFEPTVEGEIDGRASPRSRLLAATRRAGAAGASLLRGAPRRPLRQPVRARSVPRQSPPYRPLAEVVADQHVFELTDVEGTMVGFRFPAYVEGIEVGGYHLHFVDAERKRGGHVLGSRSSWPAAGPDRPLDDLHVELPPGIDLADPDLAAAPTRRSTPSSALG